MSNSANAVAEAQTNQSMAVNSSDDFLSELLSGLENTTQTPTAPLSAVEEDQLALLGEAAHPVTVQEVQPEPKAPKAKAEPKAKAAAKVKAEPKAKAEKPAAAPVEEVAPVIAKVEEVAPVAAPVAAEPAQKPAPAPRIVFALKSQKIAHKLGEKAREFLIMDERDESLSDAELEKKQAELLSTVDKMAVKVGEKATMLFGYLRNGGKLNEIMRRAFVLLCKDGHLSTGDKGNLIGDFLNTSPVVPGVRPYSIGTARSQATQIFQLFPALGICNEREAGKLTLNEHSTILKKMKAELGI